MGWSIAITVDGFGATDTQYTLDLPGLGLGAPETINKTVPSEAWSSGTIMTAYTRTISGETWGIAGGPIKAAPGGYVVQASSGSGTPTATASPIKKANVSAYTRLSSVSAFGYSATTTVTKPAETWIANQSIYAYVKADGSTEYTNTNTVANSIGKRRYYVGKALIATVADPNKWIVGLEWATLQSFIPTYGGDAVTSQAIPSGTLLGAIVFTNTERSVFTTSYGASSPILLGYLVAADGTGAVTVGAISTGGAQGIPPSAVLFGSSVPTQSVIAQAYSGGLPSNEYYARYKFNVSITATGYVNTLTVLLPKLTLEDPVYSRLIADIPDFAVDVTLPAPVGDARIVWASNEYYDSGGFGRWMHPALVRRTVPDAAPRSGFVRNSTNRPCGAPTFVGGLALPLAGVALSGQSSIPYALGVMHAQNWDANQNVCIGIGYEALPENDVTVIVGYSGGSIPDLAQWAYYDCSSGAAVVTRIGTACAMTSAYAGSRYIGTLTPPAWPSDYRQGTVQVVLYIAGAWLISSGSNLGFGAMTWVSSAQASLPIYPFETAFPPWLASDADVAPVVNAGWIDAQSRDLLSAVSWSGTLAVSWSAGIRIDPTGIAATNTPSKMFGNLRTTTSQAMIASADGSIYNRPGSSSFWVENSVVTQNITTAAATTVSALRPSAAANFPIIVTAVMRFITNSNSCSAFSNKFDAATVKLFQASMVIP